MSHDPSGISLSLRNFVSGVSFPDKGGGLCEDPFQYLSASFSKPQEVGRTPELAT